MPAEKSRTEQIGDLYRDLLNREPDDSGLMSYLHSDLTIEQISDIIEKSTEYLGLNTKKKFNRNIGAIGTGELFVMGSSPTTDEHALSLKNSGIQSILDLNSIAVSYDHSWCVEFLNVPLDTKKPFTIEQIDKCFNFIRRNVVENQNKIFVHSNNGFSRAPLVMILFLVADKGLTFYEALRLVHSKQPSVNPVRSLMPSSVLEYAYRCRKKYGTVRKEVKNTAPLVSPMDSPPVSQPPSNTDKNIIRVTDKLFAGFLADGDIFEGLKKVGIKTIMDLNLKPSTQEDKDLRFNNIHLPLFKDQLDVLMPMVMKSMNKYMEGGSIYIHCKDKELVRVVLDSFVKSSPEILAELKKKQPNNNMSRV